MAGRSRVRTATVRLPGGEIEYQLHCVAGRRHVHIVVDDDGRLAVRAPWRFSESEASALVRSHAHWVRETLDRAAARSRLRPALGDGTRLRILDDLVELRVRHAPQRALSTPPARRRVGGVTVRTDDGSVERRGDVLHAVLSSASTERLRPLLEVWGRREAARQLPPRLDQHARRLGLWPTRVSIRGQRTRWGSCSERGQVSLNWRLVLVPWELADYVLVHELCHLRHMDHSRRFWRLVESVLPDAAARRERLRALQSALPF